jgi:hypothetical protein
VTGCDFLWAVCGVRGSVCRAVCGSAALVGMYVEVRLGSARM